MLSNASDIQEVEHVNEPMASNSINRYGPTVHAKVWGQEYYALKGEWGSCYYRLNNLKSSLRNSSRFTQQWRNASPLSTFPMRHFPDICTYEGVAGHFQSLCIPSECPLGVFLYQFEESGYE